MRAIALAGIPKIRASRRQVVTVAPETISTANGTAVTLLLEVLDVAGCVTWWDDIGYNSILTGLFREGSIYLPSPVYLGAPTADTVVQAYRLTITSGMLAGATVTRPIDESSWTGTRIIPPNTLTLAWPDNRALTLV